MHSSKTLIIGAGPAGLAVAACLRLKGAAYDILEEGDNVGTRWREHYDRLQLHTTREESHLPHLSFPRDYPVYVGRSQVVEYLERYAGRFGIEPWFGRTVWRVSRNGSGWQVDTAQGERWTAERVVLATGFNRRPGRPPAGPACPASAAASGTVASTEMAST